MKVIWVCLILAVLVRSSLESSSDSDQDYQDSTLFAYPLLIFDFLKGRAEEILEEVGGNTECAKDLRLLVQDAIFREKWAIRMLDASGKLPSGLLYGNYHVIGNFDECIEIREEKDDHVIDGKYCSVSVAPSAHFRTDLTDLLDSVALSNYAGFNVTYQAADVIRLFKMTYGLCIPKSCSISYLQNIWDYAEHTFGIPFHIHFLDVLCAYKDMVLDPYDLDKYIYALYVMYIAILLISTWYDYMIYQYMNDEEKYRNNYLIAFSLYTNSKKLFSCNKLSEDDGNLQCINGIRVLSMLWIVFGHRMLFNSMMGSVNSIYALKWKQNMENSFTIAAFLGVDTFFLISGLLLAYSYLKYKSVFQTAVTLPMFYLFRFLRLSPALLATILFYTSVFKKLSDGPAWPAVSRKFSAGCRYNGWATFFFVSNYMDIKYQCIEQSWFLSADTQLYIISPIILFNIEKKPWKTCLACLGFCVFSAAYAFIITFNNNYPTFYFEGTSEYQHYLYTPTFVRMPPWLLGMVFGYLIFKYKQISIPRGANLSLWVFSLSIMIFLILVQCWLTRSAYNVLIAATYNSLARPAWAIAFGLIIFSCVTGHGGLINKFLSLPVFRVGVRISYSLYLVHIAVLMYFICSRRTPPYFSNMKGMHDFMGDIVFIIMVSTVWCLFFESPFMIISKILYNTVTGKGYEVVSASNDNAVSVYYHREGDALKKSK